MNVKVKLTYVRIRLLRPKLVTFPLGLHTFGMNLSLVYCFQFNWEVTIIYKYKLLLFHVI